MSKLKKGKFSRSITKQKDSHNFAHNREAEKWHKKKSDPKLNPDVFTAPHSQECI